MSTLPSIESIDAYQHALREKLPLGDGPSLLGGTPGGTIAHTARPVGRTVFSSLHNNYVV